MVDATSNGVSAMLPIYALLDDLLDAGTMDRRQLCVVDGFVTQWMQACIRPDQNHSIPPAESAGFAGVARRLAKNWQRIGALDRADDLFEQAYLNFDRHWHSRHLAASVLNEWISLKLDEGDLQRAGELSAIATKAAMDAYNCGVAPKKFLIWEFAQQEEVLRASGDIDGAEEVRKRARNIAALPDKCRGNCIADSNVRPCN